MKESILDVLLYLFEHYFCNDVLLFAGDAYTAPGGSLENEMVDAGFTPMQIRNAIHWLDGLTDQRPRTEPAKVAGSVRVLHPVEMAKLAIDARGFLLFLEQQGVVDVYQRELVLDRAMALDQETVELDDLKWVVLMVLFNQPDSEAAYAWMEIQMDADDPEPVH